MNISSETRKKIYDLSDTDIMNGVKAILDDIKNTVSNAQVKNLENICLSLKNVESVMDFINHQIEKGKNRDFYLAIKKYIQEDIEKFVNMLARSEEEDKVRYILVKEFIQHLVSENMYRNIKKDKNNKRRRHNNERD